MFNELIIDSQYVNYQSKLNSSWFLGFDNEGNPLLGNDTSMRDGSSESLRCYHFTKLQVLSTSTLYFPEALDLIGALDAASTQSKLPPALAHLAAERLKQEPRVHSFQQNQLINMTRFRNILKFQLGLSASQPIGSVPLVKKTNGKAIGAAGRRHKPTKKKAAANSGSGKMDENGQTRHRRHSHQQEESENQEKKEEEAEEKEGQLSLSQVNASENLELQSTNRRQHMHMMINYYNHKLEEEDGDGGRGRGRGREVVDGKMNPGRNLYGQQIQQKSQFAMDSNFKLGAPALAA